MSHLLLLSSVFTIALATLCGSPALATQPLTEFLSEAKTRSFQAREQAAASEQRRWEKGAALGRLLPSFSARGVYQHNEFEVQVALPGRPEPIVITPKNQLDALLQLDVPLIDIAGYHRYRQAEHAAAAMNVQSELVGTDIERAVARAYYSFLAGSALVQAAEQSVASAQKNVDYVKTRREVGVALELDYERALANVERIRQDLADAVLMRDLAGRSLTTLSGITPTPPTSYPEDDLRPEDDIAMWLASKETPIDRVQQRLTLAAASGRRAAASVLLPTLSVNGQQRFTNAAGFVGRTEYYTLQAVLSWRLDYGTYATAQAQAAAAQVQNIVSERSRRGLEDSIFDAYKRVEAGLAKSASARLQAAAARKAAELAVARYGVGAVTQLDVTQSQREAFQAEAGRIGADADLAYARALLRTAAGKPIDESHVHTHTAAPSTADLPPGSLPDARLAEPTSRSPAPAQRSQP